MSGSTFGQLLCVTNFGESHGPAIGCVVDGCPPGLPLSEADLQPDLDRRKPGTSRHVTQRRESDRVEILSGVYQGVTTGTPIALLIRNEDARSGDYAELTATFRPGHADYTYWRKYGIRDPRGGGRASARLTAPMVAAGAIARKWLGLAFGTRIRGHLQQLGDVAVAFESWEMVDANPFFAASLDCVPQLEAKIDALRRSGDSCGAVVRVVASSVPAGLGSPLYDKLDARIIDHRVAMGIRRGMAGPRTLYDKLWDEHVVHVEPDGTTLLYIDRHLIHEVTSPQAYEGLRLAGREPWRASSIVATADHNTPTRGWHNGLEGIAAAVSREQIVTLDANILRFGAAAYFPFRDREQGIVHVIGPEQGATLPGMTVVCGDSHTSTHGALGALAFGIGTSEVEHVLATQTLMVKKARNFLVQVDGALGSGVSAKDVVLDLIGRIGTAGATGFTIEFGGSTVRGLSLEARMTLCNMSIAAVAHWDDLHSDPGAYFDRVLKIDASRVEPQVTWGTSPEMVCAIGGTVPDPARETDAVRRAGIERALEYMGLTPGLAISDIRIDKVFIGSCTNSRIEDLREAARVVRGRRVAASVKQALVVPGSGLVKAQAQTEGLDRVFAKAG